MQSVGLKIEVWLALSLDVPSFATGVGSNHVYIYRDPAKDGGRDDGGMDWSSVQREAAAGRGVQAPFILLYLTIASNSICLYFFLSFFRLLLLPLDFLSPPPSPVTRSQVLYFFVLLIYLFYFWNIIIIIFIFIIIIIIIINRL